MLVSVRGWLDATSPVLKNQLEAQVLLAWEPPDMGCQNMNVDAPRRTASGGFAVSNLEESTKRSIQMDFGVILKLMKQGNASAVTPLKVQIFFMQQFEHCTLLHVYREKNAMADGIANGAITLIWEPKFDRVVLFVRRLQIMIKDVNEQLQSSAKTNYSFFLEIYPMQLSMARIRWEEILLSLHLSHHATCLVMRDTENFQSAYVIFPKSADKPNMCFSWKCLQTWSVLQRGISNPTRRIGNHRNCLVGG